MSSANDIGWSVKAGQDLSATQWQAIAIGGTITADPNAAVGIQQANKASGQDVPLVSVGISKAKAGGAVTAGAKVTVTTSGFFIAASSGGVGTALETVTSGSIFKGMFNFASHTYPG